MKSRAIGFFILQFVNLPELQEVLQMLLHRDNWVAQSCLICNLHLMYRVEAASYFMFNICKGHGMQLAVNIMHICIWLNYTMPSIVLMHSFTFTH